MKSLTLAELLPGAWWGYHPEAIRVCKSCDRLEPATSTIRLQKVLQRLNPLTAINNLWTGFGGAKDPQLCSGDLQSSLSSDASVATDPG